MWTYNKMLQYPINLKNRNPKMAKVIISQYGGPDGELAASLRYLSQRFAMPDQKAKATLNDIGTEELSSLRNGWNTCTPTNRWCMSCRTRKSWIRSLLYRPWGGFGIYPKRI